MTWSNGALAPKKTKAKRVDAAPASIVVNGGTPYGRKALEDECDAVGSAAEGERNNRLNQAAFALGQLVAGGELNEHDARNSLRAAAAACGLGENEREKTIASGFEAGRKEPRSAPELPKAENDSEPARELDCAPASKPKRQPLTVADVIAGFREEGPLVHEPTGIAKLDELTGGGLVYGSRVYLNGAPDAGKTALLIQLAHTYAKRGIAVGLLAVDEEAGDLVTRLAQRVGYSRRTCEIRDKMDLDQMHSLIGDLPIRIYDAEWTIEEAANDLAAWAKANTGGLAMLGIDSTQTVKCDAERTAQREMSEVTAVTARVAAIRRKATEHRLIAVATSEMGRGAYASGDPERQTNTMASGKWSGAIEYSARVLIGLRSVSGESDTVEIDVAKNKLGPKGVFYLRIDRASQTLNEIAYEPPPPRSAKDKAADKVEQTGKDAEIVAQILAERPGLGVRELRAAVKAKAGIGVERVDAALAHLGSRVTRAAGKRGAVLMSLRLDD